MRNLFRRSTPGPNWLGILLVLGAFACLLPDRLPGPSFLAQQKVWVAGAYLLLGLVGLFLGSNRLLFVCLGCSAAISFYLHETGTSQPPAGDQVLNIENCEIDERLVIRIKKSNTNFVSIRPVTATEDSLLCRRLADTYPYHNTTTANGGNWSWFSRQMFVGCDTLEVRGER